MSTAELKAHSKADLVKMAKTLGIAGGSGMLKDDLVKAVAKASKSQNASAKRRGAAKKSSKKVASESKASVKSPRARKSAGISAKATSGKARGGSRSSKSAPAATDKEKPTKSRGNPKRKAASGGVNSAAKSKSKGSRGTKSKSTSGKSVSSSPRKGVERTVSDKTRAKKAVPKKAVPKKATQKKSSSKSKAPSKPTNPRVLKRIRELQLQRESSKDVSLHETRVRPPGASEPIWEKSPEKDRVSLFVRDAYWLHVSWDVTRQAIERAKAAMAEQWHTAKPVLRLVRMDESGTNAETAERDIEIHGGIRNWYIDWNDGAASLRVLLGYLSANGRFHSLCESNIVKTPAPGSTEDVDEHWSDLGPEGERIFALSGGYDSERETGELKDMLEDRLHRELGAPALAKLGASSDSPFQRKNQFHFDMDVELVVYGSTTTDGYLTLNGEPVALRDDGTFALRLPFPDRRQVIPAVACSRDGSQQRMIVVAVERNTKVMEPMEKEHDALD